MNSEKQIVWTNILQKAEENIWKQCTALLALMQLLAIPYNRCEQQKWVFVHGFLFITGDTTEDIPFFCQIEFVAVGMKMSWMVFKLQNWTDFVMDRQTSVAKTICLLTLSGET